MSSLNILPVEALEWITSVILTSDQVHLWLCGDRLLNRKLVQGGLESTSLHWSSIPWMPWPRSFFAIFTGLRVVSWNVVTRSSLCPTLELNHLPPTLRRLQLDCDDIFCILWKKNVNLNELFPALEVLKLQGKRLREENLKQLPRRLLELSVTAIDSGSFLFGPKIESKVIFRDLPTMIEHLDFSFPVKDLGELENDLPSGLTYLRLTSLETNFDWFPKLPKSLTKLIISMQGNEPDWHSLPAQLEELDIFSDDRSKSLLHSLPIHLKALKLFCVDFDDDDVALLPKNLTSLKIISPIGAPPGVTHVGLQRLPTTLTDYDLSIRATHPEILSFFNPGTTHMNLQISSIRSEMKQIPFPTKLSSLAIDIINDNICQLLPPQLTHFKAERGLITSKGASKLPKSLTFLSLNVGVFNTNETISYLGYIPSIYLGSGHGSPQRNLNEDWLSYLRPLSPLPSISDTENNTPNQSSPQTEMNCGVMGELEIFIVGSSPHILGEASFQSLSRFTHLSTLHITEEWVSTTIPAHYIQFVPKSLTDLRFGSLSDFPTSSDLKTLPKRLRSLIIQVADTKTCSWKDEDIEILPRSLQIFRVQGDMHSFPNLTGDILKLLPPYLSTMTLKLKLPGFDRFSAVDRLYGPSESSFSPFGRLFGPKTGSVAPAF